MLKDARPSWERPSASEHHSIHHKQANKVPAHTMANTTGRLARFLECASQFEYTRRLSARLLASACTSCSHIHARGWGVNALIWGTIGQDLSYALADLSSLARLNFTSTALQ